MNISLNTAALLLLILALTLASNGQAANLKAGIPDTLLGISAVDGHFKSELPIFEDIATCFEQGLKQKIHWRSLPTKRLLHALETASLDIIYPMGFNEERNQYLQPSIPIISSYDLWIFNKQKQPDFQDESLLVGAKFASPQQNLLESKGWRNTDFQHDYTVLFNMILLQRLDAILVPSQLWTNFIESNPEAQDQLDTSVYLERQVGFYFNPTLATDKLAQWNSILQACKTQQNLSE